MYLLVDSPIIIEFLKGNNKVVDIFLKAEKLYISVFDYSMLMAGIYNSEKINHNLYIIKNLIKENFEIINFERKEAECFGKLKLKYPNVKNMWLMNISIAKIYNLTLFTMNENYHSLNVKGLKII